MTSCKSAKYRINFKVSMKSTDIRVLLQIKLNSFKWLGVSLGILVVRLRNKKGQVANSFHFETSCKEALLESAVLLYD